MSFQLELHTQPEVPLEAEVLTPAYLDGLKQDQVTNLGMLHGNQSVEVGEFFHVHKNSDDVLRIEGDLSRVKMIGAGMTAGHVIIDGHAGAHLGVGMTGGQIEVTGNASDWVGPEMEGGRIIVRGNAGHMIGAAHRGSPIGILGGEIIIFGNAKNEVGSGMRRGLIAIGGDAGDFVGVNMLAGTIIVLGEHGIRAGAGMKRGSIVCMHEVPMLPTFNYVCKYHPIFLRFYLLHLRKLGMPIQDEQVYGQYHRWCGDGIELNRGEVLVFDGVQ